MIMYLGNLVEVGPPEAIFKNPQHPYTQALISAIPMPDPSIKKEIHMLTGEIPSPMNIPTGCPFHPRCPKQFNECSIKKPTLKTVNQSDVACLLY